MFFSLLILLIVFLFEGLGLLEALGVLEVLGSPRISKETLGNPKRPYAFSNPITPPWEGQGEAPE
jgi:hypothetical protein